MSSRLELLAARKQLLATRCSLQRLRAAYQIEQLRARLPFGGRAAGAGRVARFAGIALMVLRVIRFVMRLRRSV